MKAFLVSYSMHSKAYCVYSKHTRLIKESIHIVFNESNDGNTRSSFFQELRLNRYDNEEEEEEEARAKINKEHQEAFTNLGVSKKNRNQKIKKPYRKTG